MKKLPTEDEVLSYFDKLSNWGKWGDDDQLGTLNYINDEITRKATTLVKKGRKISCSRPIKFEQAPDITSPSVHYMLESGDGLTSEPGAKETKITSKSAQMAMEYIGMVFHGHSITHIDSLAHFFWKGKMYNNQPAHLISTSLGATSESVELASEGIVTRGVLVDIPRLKDIPWVDRGQGVLPEDIIEAEEKFGFKIQEGDVLLIRTGQYKRRTIEGPVNPTIEGSAACHAACLPLFHEKKIAVLGSDTSNDILPAPYQEVKMPIHQVGIVAMGLWILDNANLEDLAEACAFFGRWEFMININPLKLSNTTGSPVNPIAVF
jgi:kynurenine formamidase